MNEMIMEILNLRLGIKDLCIFILRNQPEALRFYSFFQWNKHYNPWVDQNYTEQLWLAELNHPSAPPEPDAW